MKKRKKRLMALLVVFTSIVSFLPTGFNQQSAKAASTSSSIPEAATIHVYDASGNTPTEITATTDTTTNDEYYSSKFSTNQSGSFDLGVKDVMTTTGALVTTANTNMATASGSISGVTSQIVDVTAVNDISCETDAEKNTLNSTFGISVSSSSTTLYPGIIGQKITGMPLGVNKIKYNITVTTTSYSYTASTKDSQGNVIPASYTGPTTSTQTYSDQEATIYFGAEYVTSTINPMTFKAYVGDSSYFNSNDVITDETQLTNNESPFLYTTEKAIPNTDMPLKYTFDVPFSVTKLDYIMNFNDTAYSSATIYRNGSKATFNITTSGNSTQLSGSLGKPGAEDLILIKVAGSASNIERTFCVEVNYNYPAANTDYTLYKAGITKGQYASDDNVKAYVDKTFTISKDTTNTYNVYTGNIYISEKADTVCIDPTLVVDKDKASNQRTLAYVVTNHYYDSSTGTTKIEESSLSGGKQYVDFNKGSTNQLYVDVYNNGSNGSVTSSSTLVTRYILKVNLLDTTSSSFSMNLAFDDNDSTDSTYLTQPGVKLNQLDFSSSRRTYDLYTENKDEVKVSFTGTKSSNNEYLKIWTASQRNSNSLTSASMTKSGDDYTVDLTGAKKMVVQAYYDSTTGAAVSYSVGEQYIIYLPENYDSSDTDSSDTGGTTSDNALLNYLKVKGATLKDSSGDSGFTSSEYSYTTTVEKDSTTAQITATAEDDNVESIVATVTQTGTSYNLSSGEASTITLDTSGTTTVEIVVTAQDGTTTKTYTVLISNKTESSTATLKDVILNTGDYTFDSSETITKVRVGQNTTSITVTPIPTDSNSVVTVNGQIYSTTAITVSLKGSQTTNIEIIVESQDGTATTTYTLEVTRTDSSNVVSSSDDSADDDQYYDEYNECWVDTTKYDEWGTVDGKPAYFDKNNRQVKNAWIRTGGKYYYLNNLGYRASGWKVDSANGKTYYLDPTSGEMKIAWINLNNAWYYLDPNGVMHKGWLYLNKKWYYFMPTGQMVVNQTMYVDDKNYTFGQDGTVTSTS